MVVESFENVEMSLLLIILNSWQLGLSTCYCWTPSSSVNGTREIPRVCFSALAGLSAELKLGRVFRCLSRWTETRWFQKGGSQPTCSWARRFQVSSEATLEKVLRAAASLASGYICLLYNYVFSSSVLLTDSSLVEAVKKLWLLWQQLYQRRAA